MNYVDRVTKAFLYADIPLGKISNPAIKELFESMGNILPSESTCRRNEKKINVEIIERNKRENFWTKHHYCF